MTDTVMLLHKYTADKGKVFNKVDGTVLNARILIIDNDHDNISNYIEVEASVNKSNG